MTGAKMSKHGVLAREIRALLARLSELRQEVLAASGKSFPMIVIQAAGLEGSWVHPASEKEGI